MTNLSNNNKIIAVAIKIKDLVVSLPPPNRHHNIINLLGDYGWLTDDIRKHDQWVQGFIDATGNFRTREEAMEIAKAANQLLRPSNKTGLFSEDLW